jgi:hypothetical protein
MQYNKVFFFFSVLFWVVTCGLGLKMETVHFSEMLVSAYNSTVSQPRRSSSSSPLSHSSVSFLLYIFVLVLMPLSTLSMKIHCILSSSLF